VIHRDLKPSNVLVALQDGKSVPKVIDFGLARLTQGRPAELTYYTQHGQMLGTPAYMSPEQAEMTALDVDTRTDVYSLGALLYELLVGAAPFDAKALRQVSHAEMQRIIREVEPPKPSTKLSTLSENSARIADDRHVEPQALARLLRGDMDWIVLKAMDKDRTRRYATPLDLAADIRRHLNRETVLARPPTLGYRLGRLLRRHKAAVVTAAAVFVGLVASLVVMTWLYLKAAAATQLADERRREAEAVNNFLVNDLLAEASPERNPVGSATVLRKVFDKAAQKIESAFADQPALEAPLRRTLGRTYLNLGRDADAEPHLRTALNLYRRTRGPGDPDTLNVMNALVYALLRQGRSDAVKRAESEALSRECLELCRSALGPDHVETLTAGSNWANVLAERGDLAAAEKEYRQVLEGQARVRGPEHRATLWTMENLASVLLVRGDYARAEELYRQVLDARRRLLGLDHPDTLNAQHNLLTTLNNLGSARRQEALLLAEQTLERRRQVLGAEHESTVASLGALAASHYEAGNFLRAEQLYREQAESAARNPHLGPQHITTLLALNNQALALLAQGRLAEAELLYTQNLEKIRRTLRADHPLILSAVQSLANVYHKMGRLAEAEARYRQALTLEPPQPREDRLGPLLVMNSLAGVLLDKETLTPAELAEVESLCQAALDGRRRVLPAGHRNLGNSLETSGRLLLKKGQPEQAEGLLREAVKTFEANARANDWELSYAKAMLGACLSARGQYAEAEPLLLEAAAKLGEHKGAPQPRVRQVFNELVRFYEARQMPGKAAEWRKQLAELPAPQDKP
jgi:non-specific serine/threonine protein kinase/serine/threonine-protein kinase